MGNRFSSCTPGATSQPPKGPIASSPQIIPSDQDIVCLLMGPVGAEIALFVELAMQQQSPNVPQTLEGPTRFSERNIHTFRASVPGHPRPVVLVVPPLFDGARIKEKDIIKGITRWLHRTTHPYVDHILYFAEAGSHYNIPLTPLCNYLSSLESLSGTSDRRRLCSKISLVHTAAAADIPAAWAFLETNGSRGFVFEGAESVQNILQEVVA